MALMGKRKGKASEREARELAHDYTQFDEGTWIGATTADAHPASAAVIRRFNETKEGRKQCPHLSQNWDQARFWVEAVPELVACKQCTPRLAAEEQKRADTRCVICRRHVPVRGISVAVRGYLMRAGMCKACEAKHGLPGSSAA
jgi:hypothetical protein